MSDATLDQIATQPSILPKPPSCARLETYLMHRIVEDIAPYLELEPEDRANVRKLGWNIAAAYDPRNEAEALHATRIISLSFTELGVLRDANKPDLKPEQRIEYIKLALSLNRTVCTSERELRLLRRFGLEQAGPIQRMQPAAPRDAAADARIEALAAEAFAAYRADLAAMRAADSEASAPPAAEEAAPQPPHAAPADPLAASATLGRPVADPVDPPPAPRPQPVHPAPGGTLDPASGLRAQVAAAHAALHQALRAGSAAARPSPGPDGLPAGQQRRTA